MYDIWYEIHSGFQNLCLVREYKIIQESRFPVLCDVYVLRQIQILQIQL